MQSSIEGIDTEFKSARGGIWESYFAMANTQGGTIVLSVAEKPTGLAWEGVLDAAPLRRVLWGSFAVFSGLCFLLSQYCSKFDFRP